MLLLPTRRCAPRAGDRNRFRSMNLDTMSNKLFTLRTLVEARVGGGPRPARVGRPPPPLPKGGPPPAGGIVSSAITNPDAIAVIDELGSLTFDEINRRTNALAHKLS